MKKGHFCSKRVILGQKGSFPVKKGQFSPMPHDRNDQMTKMTKLTKMTKTIKMTKLTRMTK